MALLLLATPVAAQDIPIRRLELSVGGGWLSGETLGAREARLRQTQPLRLFGADTELTGGPSVDVAAGFAFTRRWMFEGGVAISRPEVRTSVRADAEGAPAITVAERVDQYVVEGRLVVLLDEVRLGARTVPFAAAGAGYLRQLHEGRTVIEEGHVVHVGGGVRHRLFARGQGLVRGIGLRGDARLALYTAGISFDDGPRPRAAASGAVFVTF
jgi:hypothetical protein